MGPRIVAHSFRMLFRNLGNALRVSLGPYVLGTALVALLFWMQGGTELAALSRLGPDLDPAEGARLVGALALPGIAALVIFLFVSSWVAVAWHRYVLAEDYPGLFPRLAGRPVWPYAGRVVALFLVLVAVTIPVMIAANVILMATGGAAGVGSLITIGLTLGLTWLWLRLGLVLPAVALDRPLTLAESWRRTADLDGEIIVIVVILLALNMGAGMVLSLVLGNGLAAAVAGLVVDWISIMVGISILTTLYGILIQGRSIP